MTALLAPFTGFVPTAEFGARVVGPPRSMLAPDMKRVGEDDELSFRYSVGRGAGADRTEAIEWMRQCEDVGAIRPVESAVVIHRMERAGFRAMGLLADVSLTAYDSGLIKRHETTIAKTERKMVDYMESTRLYGNPVVLAHHGHPEVGVSLTNHSRRPADVEFVTIDGMQHSLWIIEDDAAVKLCSSFRDVLYITDGHHRLAAAASLAADENRSDPHMPAGLFAEEELQLWSFARALRDESINVDHAISTLSQDFVLEESSDAVPRPPAPRSFGVRIGERSFVLTIPDNLVPDDVYDGLDVNLLQDLVLEPLFNVTNQRTDARLDFIADTPDGVHEPDSYDAWFLPYATSVWEVMAVADIGRAMPPKSTFFLPKLPAGLVVRPLNSG